LALLEALAAGVYATCLLALQFYIFSQMAAGKIGSDFPSHLALISQKKEGVPHFMFHLIIFGRGFKFFTFQENSSRNSKNRDGFIGWFRDACFSNFSTKSFYDLSSNRANALFNCV
jgi:hypothetical protein